MTRKFAVLVVDDESRALELLNRSLKPIASVSTAVSAEIAWSCLNEQVFDLVISDHRMPGERGVDFLSRVAVTYPHTGRVLLTAFADHSATVAAINDARIHAYIRKPFQPDHLRAIASAVVERCLFHLENERLVVQLRDKADELEEVIASLKRETSAQAARAAREAVAGVLMELETPVRKVSSHVAALEADLQRDAVRGVRGAVSALRGELDQLRAR